MAGKLCAALQPVEAGGVGIVVASPEIWQVLEAARLAAEGSAGEGGGGGKKLSRNHKGIKRARTFMAVAARMGFGVATKLGTLVFEGRHPSGMKGMGEVAVYAFKSDQYRAYGGYLNYGASPCFVIVEADEAKKKDVADQTLLRRAAMEVAKLARDARDYPLKVGEPWPTPAKRNEK